MRTSIMTQLANPFIVALAFYKSAFLRYFQSWSWCIWCHVLRENENITFFKPHAPLFHASRLQITSKSDHQKLRRYPFFGWNRFWWETFWTIKLNYLLYLYNECNCRNVHILITASVVYQATVTRSNTNEKQAYVGFNSD